MILNLLKTGGKKHQQETLVTRGRPPNDCRSQLSPHGDLRGGGTCFRVRARSSQLGNPAAEVKGIRQSIRLMNKSVCLFLTHFLRRNPTSLRSLGQPPPFSLALEPQFPEEPAGPLKFMRTAAGRDAALSCPWPLHGRFPPAPKCSAFRLWPCGCTSLYFAYWRENTNTDGPSSFSQKHRTAGRLS